ncbi:DUF4439 domain-containing protein [Nocardioides sp.]|uniref:DUF4439 domain-containing protein n=1 Tax=Nocardioides sp. TaxID=35761 RepID=UPI003512C4A8
MSGTTSAPSPGSSSSPGTDGAERSDAASAEVEALQTVLAAEHAAVFVLAALGARTSSSGDPRGYRALTSAYDVHRGRRDQVERLLAARRATPVAAEPAYALPLRPDAAATRRRAASLEESCAATYAYLVARSSGAVRQFGVEALIDAAVRAVGLGAAPDRLPGL